MPREQTGASRVMDRGRSAGNRLSNLVKLYHVPVFALRELLESRVIDIRATVPRSIPHNSGSTRGGIGAVEGRFHHLRQAELIREADEMPVISEADIEELYENYRYGRRLSFYLYLLPPGLEQPQIGEVQAVLDELAVLGRRDLLDEFASGQDYESDAFPNQISLLDEEYLEEVREIRFRYFIAHRFLNADEEPDEVLQSRYGFLWLDLELGYLALLSREERVNSLLTTALSKCLQAIPLPIRFSKELLDKHFSIEKAKHLSYYDPSTGIHRSLSGPGLWQRFEQEIMARELRYTRPTSLYDEEVAEGIVSGVGISAGQGKIYLTRTLPTSVVRDWARRRLPEMIRDVKDLRAVKPDTIGHSVEAINRARLPSPGKAVMISLVETLLQLERDGLTSTELPLTALEIYEALEGKYFSPYLRTQCNECDGTAELCPFCESRQLEFDVTALHGEEGEAVEADNHHVTCEACGATISDGQAVALRCMNGHITNVPLVEAWNIAPNHWLQKRMARIFAELGQFWDEKNDYFHVEGSTLHRIRRGDVERDELPQVIQNYISNFWDPVTGQIHAGSGAIVLGCPPPEGQAGSGRPFDSASLAGTAFTSDHDRPGKIHPYTGARGRAPMRPLVARNFDVWLRGDAVGGYTVEAFFEERDSIGRQPLRLPRDRAFQHRLDSLFEHADGNGNVQAAGKTLFNAIFPPPIRRLWTSALGKLKADEGLRVALHIEPPELLALPWELLFEEGYLGLDSRLSAGIVRCVDTSSSPWPLATQPPVRVLVAAGRTGSGVAAGGQRGDGSSGSGEAPLPVPDLGSLAAQMPGRLQVDLWDRGKMGSLPMPLSRGYHVLHFVGQAVVEKDEVYLVVPGLPTRSVPGQGNGAAARRPEQLSALQLGQAAARSTLRLVVLSGLSTGDADASKRRHLFDALARQLVQNGLPAVVVLERSMTDEATSALHRAFYGALADGWPVDAALQAGRQTILYAAMEGGARRGIDWAVPALYMRTPGRGARKVTFRDVVAEGPARRKGELRPTVTYTPTFHGPIQGPVHTGRGDLAVATLQYGVEADDLGDLFGALYRLVEEQAPPDQKEEALRKVKALEESVKQDQPDPGRMELVLTWFKKNLPKLAGAVTSVILHPIVGKVVEAAGELIAEEFKRRFG